MTTQPIRRFALPLLLGLVAAPSLAGYGYYRTLEGSAAIVAPDPTAIELNYPVVPGDRIRVEPRSRLETLLPDGSILRLAAGSELEIVEADDTETLLRFDFGELQLVTYDRYSGLEPVRVDTSNATIYIGEPGTYRLETDVQRTRLVVRQGFAEVLTPQGSIVARAGEEVSVLGFEQSRTEVRAAGGETELELWGRHLDDVAAAAQAAPVASELRYASSSLSSHGRWVTVGTRSAWRPYVAVDWRPYTYGSWRYTPAGLTWASYEPWGWVPYHYGSWDYVPGYGWVWYPGAVYAPAWVYWYWGPSYVGWCPTGYYHRYYGYDLSYGFRFGVHGWAHPRGDALDHWNLVPIDRIKERRLAVHTRTGRELGGQALRLEQGVITTDTRDLSRDGLENPRRAVEELKTRARDLPDVSDFVARRDDLQPDVKRAALDRPDPDQRRDAVRSGLPSAIDDRRVGLDDSRRDEAPGRDGDRDRTPTVRGDEWRGDDRVVERDRGRADEDLDARREAPAARTDDWRSPNSEADRDRGRTSADLDARREVPATRTDDWRSPNSEADRDRGRTSTDLDARREVPATRTDDWRSTGYDSPREPIRTGTDTRDGPAARDESWREGTVSPVRRVVEGVRDGGDDDAGSRSYEWRSYSGSDRDAVSRDDDQSGGGTFTWRSSSTPTTGGPPTTGDADDRQGPVTWSRPTPDDSSSSSSTSSSATSSPPPSRPAPQASSSSSGSRPSSSTSSSSSRSSGDNDAGSSDRRTPRKKKRP